MKLTKKETETLRKILEKIEDDQKKEKMRIKDRRKMQKQGKSINKGKVRKQSRPNRSQKRITRRT
ncbi:MAG: hypothetical protein R3327_02210 [Nitrosopumilaceae archaeon]|nr:hypothetical protein [Nitrosopumilaceae archaeon]